MRTEIIALVLLMALVTYVPRMLPAFIIGKIKLGRKTEKFLKLIPYTAMVALIFPGIFSVDESRFYIGLIGGGVAAILAYFKCPVIVCVLAAIATNLLVLNFLI